MGFLGVYKAIYDYAPQGEGELQIVEGDILYVLEKSEDDDWWKAKKKASADDEDEPVGLIPNNYIEEAQPEGKARALYEYTRQTDEELSFPEDAQLAVYDTSDPDWILVGHDGDYGFAPANYIEIGDGGQEQEEPEPSPAIPAPPPLPVRSPDVASPPLPARSVPAEPESPTAPNPAAALAGLMASRAASSSHTPAPITLPPRPTYREEESEEDAKSPPLPTRPRGDSHITASEPVYEPSYRSPAPDRHSQDEYSPRSPPQTPQTAAITPGGFHMYNINEMASVMGKKKKMPTTLGINLRTGNILVAPERNQDGPSQEWPAANMTHYSREGKHVFMELVKPSKSFDFHAGAKDTAEEIVAMLGELAGAVRAEGLREIIIAGTGQGHTQKKGKVLYDFMAQGDDEVTVGVGDEVIILDDAKSEEWWQVRRLKNNKEGVVPSSYIEVTGTIDVAPSSSTTGINAGRSLVEQNRLEEQRLTKEAVKAAQREEQREREREKRHSERGRGENGRADGSGSSKSKSKPDKTKVRTWKDRSGTFSVEAQFLGVKDGKLNLHKTNGVKIAVPVEKMSLKDLEYVERVTGISLDEDKPLSELKKKKNGESSSALVGATIEQPKKPDYDWFQFFLSCDVQVGLCERYAQAFSRDSMDESVLPDVDASVLRNLGLREGDIIKVMRFLDAKYGRTKKAGGAEEPEGGLFSGPGGTLRNNTRKGRPAPPVETSNVVDPKAFALQSENEARASSPTAAAPQATGASEGSKPSTGFDDDAWSVKPAKKAAEPAPQPAARAPEPTPAPAPAPAAVAPKPAPLTGAMSELSLLTQPLQPEKVQPPPPAPALNLAPAPAPAPVAAPPAQIPQPTGATPQFFSGLQAPAVNGQQLPQAITRQRPMAPQYTQGQAGLMPPPPSRPLSAPQSAQPSAFTPPPLQPQMTGYAPQVAPPGHSLNDIAQQRLQQQYTAMQMQAQPQIPQQQMGMMPMMTGIPQQQVFPNQFMPQPTGIMNGPQMMQSPFANPPAQQPPFGQLPMQPQPTGMGFGGFTPQPQQPQPTGFGVNSILPPPLEPQRTAMPQMQMPQPTGFGTYGQPPPPMPPQPTGFGMQPALLPQKTGPPPPVRFGVSAEAKKIAPQPTGRRANLAAATPQNPFGF